jgi:hypothetical protein
MDNNEPTKKEPTNQEINDAIFNLENSRIILNISPALFDKLNFQAEFHKISVEEHCENVLRQSLERGVGSAMISAPSQMSGQEDLKKITGPTFSVTRVG